MKADKAQLSLTRSGREEALEKVRLLNRDDCHKPTQLKKKHKLDPCLIYDLSFSTDLLPSSSSS